ncbi:hypothetical protein PI124_g21188 [Phytophthora idaei]|nr:hypothetical protein PI125_g22447 [Phytophthora idaei]KAG3130131.1 hypothetical protein PI126_g20640 [Phytophthora idaei]KAG3233743.1 hypothetical protein PI124_g21188 [Phytophthora idaei]
MAQVGGSMRAFGPLHVLSVSISSMTSAAERSVIAARAKKGRKGFMFADAGFSDEEKNAK